LAGRWRSCGPFKAAKHRGVAITRCGQVEPRHSLIGTRPEECGRGRGRGQVVPWRTPISSTPIYRPGHRRQFSQQRFLHHRRRGLHRQVGLRRGHRRVRGRHAALRRALRIRCGRAVTVTAASLQAIAAKYLSRSKSGPHLPPHRAGEGEGNFVTEVSFDEANTPQTPAELFFILAGRHPEDPWHSRAQVHREFLKGIDYVGDSQRLLANSTRISRSGIWPGKPSDARVAQAEHSSAATSSRSTPSSPAIKKADAVFT